MTDDGTTPEAAWDELVEGLRVAGERLAESTAGLAPEVRADGYRALLRGLNNQLGRFEVDRERPELVAFNGWREKMFMDNPDFRYWVADVRDDREYRITGTLGAAVYQSVTAYRSGGALDAAASARLDSDAITFDDAGRFDITVSRSRPATGDWLELPEGATAIWVRQFHDDASSDELGTCRIDPLGDPAPSPSIDVERFTRHLSRLGRGMASFPPVFAAATAHDLAHPNEVRHWDEMVGGAAFTEPNIHYVRGSWRLEPRESLVVEGALPPCRYWNVLLYGQFLNSLDHRARRVSLTGGTAQVADGSYRIVISDRDPGDGSDWLDTEGRQVGLFVFRFLQPDQPPELPQLRVVPAPDPDR